MDIFVCHVYHCIPAKRQNCYRCTGLTQLKCSTKIEIKFKKKIICLILAGSTEDSNTMTDNKVNNGSSSNGDVVITKPLIKQHEFTARACSEHHRG